MTQTIAMLVGPDYEDLEVWYPKIRLEEAGYHVPLVGSQRGEVRGKHGYPCTIDTAIDAIAPDELVGVVAPGGWAPDKLRRDPRVLALVKGLDAQQKLVASICHGPWVLISAGIMDGKRATSSVGIRDDLINAGATWVDEPVVIDGNIVTSRVPPDLPAFGRAILEVLEKLRGPG